MIGTDVSGSHQINKISEIDYNYRNQHLIVENKLSSSDRDIVRRKRMIYRSKQRGWLEVDILLGSWAAKYVPSLSSNELDEYDIILNEETIDIYNYISGKDSLPEHLAKLDLIKRIQDYAFHSKLVGPDAYEKVKRETNLV
jgi:succinate dehydrogenase assembly factor 2